MFPGSLSCGATPLACLARRSRPLALRHAKQAHAVQASTDTLKHSSAGLAPEPLQPLEGVVPSRTPGAPSSTSQHTSTPSLQQPHDRKGLFRQHRQISLGLEPLGRHLQGHLINQRHAHTNRQQAPQQHQHHHNEHDHHHHELDHDHRPQPTPHANSRAGTLAIPSHDARPQAPAPTYLEALSSMQQMVKVLGPLSLGDLLFGLQELAQQQDAARREALLAAATQRQQQQPGGAAVPSATADAAATAAAAGRPSSPSPSPQAVAQQEEEGRVISDLRLLRGLLEDLDIAHGAYRKNERALCAKTKLKEQNLIHWQPEGDYLQRGYYIAVDHVEQQVVWAVRGTKHLTDLMIDLCSAHPYMRGHTHWGMQQAAAWLLHVEGDRVADLLDGHPGYSLRLVGHSLGAGVAALMAHMVHNEPRYMGTLLTRRLANGRVVSREVTATCFAAPCVMSEEMAASCRPYVTSITFADDPVPRVHARTLAELRRQLLGVQWEAGLKARLLGGAAAAGVEVPAGVVQAVASLKKLVGMEESQMQDEEDSSSSGSGVRAGSTGGASGSGSGALVPGQQQEVITTTSTFRLPSTFSLTSPATQAVQQQLQQLQALVTGALPPAASQLLLGNLDKMTQQLGGPQRLLQQLQDMAKTGSLQSLAAASGAALAGKLQEALQRQEGLQRLALQLQQLAAPGGAGGGSSSVMLQRLGLKGPLAQLLELANAGGAPGGTPGGASGSGARRRATPVSEDPGDAMHAVVSALASKLQAAGGSSSSSSREDHGVEPRDSVVVDQASITISSTSSSSSDGVSSPTGPSAGASSASGTASGSSSSSSGSSSMFSWSRLKGSIDASSATLSSFFAKAKGCTTTSATTTTTITTAATANPSSTTTSTSSATTTTVFSGTSSGSSGSSSSMALPPAAPAAAAGSGSLPRAAAVEEADALPMLFPAGRMLHLRRTTTLVPRASTRTRGPVQHTFSPSSYTIIGSDGRSLTQEQQHREESISDDDPGSDPLAAAGWQQQHAYELVELPAGRYFDSLLIGSHVLRDHRCKAYREGLSGLVHELAAAAAAEQQQ